MSAERPVTRHLLWALAAILIVGAGFVGWRLAGASAEATGEALERPPAVSLQLLEGGRVDLGDYAGRVVIVDFWASWCGPCRLQAKILHVLHQELGDQVQFLAVNLGEDLATVERYVADQAFSYPVLMDPEEQLGYALEIYALPTVMVLDRDGGISYLRPGISDRPALVAALARAGVGGADERPS